MRRSGSVRAVTITVSIMMIVIIAVRFAFPSVFPGLFTAVARPFWRVEYSISSGQLDSVESLLAANQDLSRKLDESEVRSRSATELNSENDQLKALMGRASTTDRILAAVIAKPPFAPYDELLLDIGSDTGLIAGNMVYATGMIPIGRITDVLTHSSKVLLFSSPGQTFSVQIGGANVPATAVGQGGGQYSAELPRTTAVSQGDPVSIPSLKSNLYGIVSAVVSDPSEPFETILFAPPVNIYQLRWVLVEKSKHDQ